MQHKKATIAMWNAFMAWHLMLMLDDAHDQNFSCFLTSRMLHHPTENQRDKGSAIYSTSIITNLQ